MSVSIATTRWLRRYYLLLLVAKSWAHPDDLDAMNVFTVNSNFQEEKTLTEPCTALVKEIMSNVDRANLQCLTPSGMLYTIPHVDKEWIQQKQSAEELFSGETMLDIPPNTLIDMETQTLQLDFPPKLVNTIVVDELFRKRRRLLTRAKASGRKTVLVIRVQASNRATSLSETQLASDVFGDNGDVNNLRSQYMACSYNKLELSKAADRNGRSTNIRNGVVTIHSGTSTSVGDGNMLNALYTQIRHQFSTDLSNLADFVMFCLPPGTMDQRDIAYAWMNDYRSVYNDVHCSHVSAQMHELGHNLNMAHSGMGSNEYADKSGMMGYSYAYDDIPYMCFNSAKSWQLGWYADKSLTVTPLANGQYEYSGRLASIVDYEKADDANVLIKIQQTSSPWTFFMNYNAAKGMNRNTMEGKDQVLITTKFTGNEENLSRLVSKLDPGEGLELSSFNGKSDETLRVKFLSLTNGVADISIELSGPTVPVPTISMPPSVMPSIQPSSSPLSSIVFVFGGPTALPSNPPSTMASMPSFQPSALPTQQPTTSVPSFQPSALPTQQPTTSVPSARPTRSMLPSFRPSNSPTFKPSSKPSIGPTGTPSALPSQLPSQLPSTMPSQYPSFEPSMSQQPSIKPSMVPSSMPSQLPSKGPSSAPSASPSIKPSMVRSSMPSQLPSQLPSSAPSASPSLAPSSQPSHQSVELESSVTLEVTSIYNIDMVGLVCDGAQAYFDEVIKATYGDDTETTFTCRTEERNRKDRLLSDGTAQISAIASTIFPRGSTPPLPSEYEKYLHDVLSSDETQTLLPTRIGDALAPGQGGERVWAETDSTVDPPILKVSFGESSSGFYVLPRLCCIISPIIVLIVLAN